jgi:hypothetical protein
VRIRWLAIGVGAAIVVGAVIVLRSGPSGQAIQLPGLDTRLPAGELRRTAYFDAGLVTVESDLGTVRLEWWQSREAPIRWQALREQLRFGDRTVERITTVRNGRLFVEDAWQCSHDRWFLLDADVPDVASEIHALFDEIQERTTCTSDGERFSLETPPGYRALDSHMVRVFASPAGTLHVWWLSDRDLVATLVASPAIIIGETRPGLVVEHPRRIDRSRERPMFEAVIGDSRVLVTAFDCDPLRIDVVAMHMGPASEPREPNVATLEQIRCR